MNLNLKKLFPAFFPEAIDIGEYRAQALHRARLELVEAEAMVEATQARLVVLQARIDRLAAPDYGSAEARKQRDQRRQGIEELLRTIKGTDDVEVREVKLQ